jgi:hypothetical protein
MADPASVTTTSILVSLATGAVGGVGGALLTASLTHFFWKRQRFEELRMAVIKEVNRLTAEFITAYINAQNHPQNWPPSNEFYQSFQAAAANVKALFSADTFAGFKATEIMIGPNLDPVHGHRGVHDFIEARDTALQALYREVGFPPRNPLYIAFERGNLMLKEALSLWKQ